MNIGEKISIIDVLTLVLAVISFADGSLRGFDPNLGIIDQKLFADEINAKQNKWVAGDNFGRPLSMRELKRYGSTILNKPDLPKKSHEAFSNLTGLLNLPPFFDARQQYSRCLSLSSVRDQSNCGSCWAVTSAAALSDRFCIQTPYQINMSAEDLIACCTSCGSGCNGGFIDKTWRHFMRNGEVSGGDYGSFDGCQPYSIMPCGSIGQPECEEEEAATPKCKRFCTNPYYRIQYSHDRQSTFDAFYMENNVPYIQWEIMHNGPLVASFVLYADFLPYKSGVYVHTEGRKIGGHAARIIGWGTENGLPYWLAVNSWGTSWGDNGYFKILREYNHCGIETSMIGGNVK
ncbi:unnamed protein product [Bemisia tabaci]|uniref:Peptidase C1A papain C-terminal domain-containing protein n=1 Tax=Bemisia tabaci TaxID=7038 RepID=A0A9P0AP71_BEMTA|nr:unnamed protein product [Bemisia tabaci]